MDGALVEHHAIVLHMLYQLGEILVEIAVEQLIVVLDHPHGQPQVHLVVDTAFHALKGPSQALKVAIVQDPVVAAHFGKHLGQRLGQQVHVLVYHGIKILDEPSLIALAVFAPVVEQQVVVGDVHHYARIPHKVGMEYLDVFLDDVVRVGKVVDGPMEPDAFDHPLGQVLKLVALDKISNKIADHYLWRAVRQENMGQKIQLYGFTVEDIFSI